MAQNGNRVSMQMVRDYVRREGGPRNLSPGQIQEHFRQMGYNIAHRTCVKRLNQCIGEWSEKEPTATGQVLTEEKVLEIASRTAKLMQTGIEGEVKRIVKEAVAALPKRPTTLEIHLPERKKPKKMKGVFPVEWERILALAQLRQNMLLVGPSGCGKTFIAHKVSEALHLDFGAISCSVGMSESQLSGWLIPVGKSGQFVYVSTSFVDIFENGGVFLFDEMDAADANTTVFLNAALANGELHIPKRHKDPVARRHPDCVLIAAANTFGHGADRMYAARTQLDAATLDRFRAGIVVMDYSPEVERAISKPEVYEWAVAVRRIIVGSGLRRVMSTRLMKDITIQIEAGLPFRDGKTSYFADWSRDEMAKVPRELRPEYEEVSQ